jgi:signal transduction histidine kinase
MSYSLNTLGGIYDGMGDYPMALETYRRALGLAETMGSKSMIGRALSNIAIVYNNLSEYATAMDYAQRAVAVGEEINDERLVADSYQSLGIANAYNGEYNAAIRYYTEARVIYEKLKVNLKVATCLNNIGSAYENLGMIDEALQNYESALAIRESHGTKTGLANALNNIGTIYSNQEKYQTSLEYFNRALVVSKETGNQSEEANALSKIGIVNSRLGNRAASKQYLKSSLEISREIQEKEMIRNVLASLSRVSAETGNYRDAYRYHVEFSEVHDSIYNEQKSKQLQELEQRFQSETKQHQIDMQQANIEKQRLELEQQKAWRIMLMGGVVLVLIVLGLVIYAFLQKRSENRKISGLNQQVSEKNNLLEQHIEELKITLENLRDTQVQLIQSEKLAALGGLVAGVAHEINTPVGISVTAASSMVEETNRMADHYKTNRISRAEFKDYLNTTSQTAKLILSNMQRTATMVQSFKQVSVDQSTEQQRNFRLKEYSEDVIRSLYPRLKGKKIHINFDIDEKLELNSYPGAYSQILTNLVLNSLVHGFDGKDQGRITLTANRNRNGLLLEYSDDGRGIEPGIKDRIFEPFFTTDKKIGTGLGLHIVYNLVTQKLNGSISCSSDPGKGIQFHIRLP